jgi:hypothetical protein
VALDGLVSWWRALPFAHARFGAGEMMYFFTVILHSHCWRPYAGAINSLENSLDQVADWLFLIKTGGHT